MHQVSVVARSKRATPPEMTHYERLNTMPAPVLGDDTTPDDAFALLRAIEERFGWAIGVVTRVDADRILDHVLTDRQWEQLHGSPLWRKVLPETMFAAASETVAELASRVVGDLESEEN